MGVAGVDLAIVLMVVAGEMAMVGGITDTVEAIEGMEASVDGP